MSYNFSKTLIIISLKFSLCRYLNLRFFKINLMEKIFLVMTDVLCHDCVN